MPGETPSTLSDRRDSVLTRLILLPVIGFGGHAIYGHVTRDPSENVRKLDAAIAENGRRIDQSQARCKTVLLDWLESQRRGRDGLEFWSDSPFVRPVQLYAVRSWEIADGDWGRYTVRVASSTKGGFPIEVLWKIRLDDVTTEHPKIGLVEQAVWE